MRRHNSYLHTFFFDSIVWVNKSLGLNNRSHKSNKGCWFIKSYKVYKDEVRSLQIFCFSKSNQFGLVLPSLKAGACEGVVDLATCFQNLQSRTQFIPHDLQSLQSLRRVLTTKFVKPLKIIKIEHSIAQRVARPYLVVTARKTLPIFMFR